MSRIEVLVVAALSISGVGQAQATHWVETWTAAQQPPRAIPGSPAPAGFNNQTVRMILHTTIAGNRLRLEFANTYANQPLPIGAAHMALRASESSIVPASDRTVTVNGKGSFTIPPGGVMVTDPVNLDLPAMADLAVSVYVAGSTPVTTQHSLGLHTTYISKEGDVSGQTSLADATTSQAWYWISSVQVMAPESTAAAIAFGDSITDGFHSTPDTNRMWPAVLAARLLGAKGGPQIAVVNEAISGNQVLHDGAGVNALARFDHDVLARAGVKYLLILEGINDIGRGLGPAATPATLVSADDVIGAHRQMVERAHAHGIRAIGATLTPYEGAAYYSEKGETVRAALNAWIRTGGVYDAFIDFDAVTRDPSQPGKFKQEFDSGDHLHPNDAGYKAMADSIDLALFRK
jgi:lysophospholipase L1-like esterase